MDRGGGRREEGQSLSETENEKRLMSEQNMQTRTRRMRSLSLAR